MKTSTQLKAKARNLSAKTNTPPHIIQRNYFLERFLLLDKLRDTVKIDFTIGDVITPMPVKYGYRLMFEDREICVLAYNLETVLAEKFSALLSLDVANTRMKDFYDINRLLTEQRKAISSGVFKEAVNNTAKQREISGLIPQSAHIIDTIAKNSAMAELWKRYQAAYKYAAGIEFTDVIVSLRLLSEWCNNG